MRFRGLLYRALNPVRAREPLSGEGARLHGGRFNAKGTPTLYTSLSILTAVRESNQVGMLQPTTLVCYEADITPVFDATDPKALAALDIAPDVVAAEDWRLRMLREGRAPTQILAERLRADGHAGMLVRSFARGATADDVNMVLWTWGADRPARLRVVDDESRLS